jgi:hypothetical protein
VDTDVIIDQGGLSAVERSYTNLMALADENIGKLGFGDLMENSSPALNSFGQMFSAAKEKFYSHEIADDQADESSATFPPKSITENKNFYSNGIDQDNEVSCLTVSATSNLGKQCDGKRTKKLKKLRVVLY